MKTNRLLFCLLLFASATANTASLQSVQVIQDAVQSFVQASLDPAGQYQINSAQIDPRLQLAACTENLDIFSQSGEIKAGRNTVGIRCPGTNNWTIYSSVAVKSFGQVLILTKQLSRNDRVGPEHITAEMRDTSTLQRGYLTDAADILNQQANRVIPVGSVLYKSQFSAPTLIKRGERVSIQTGKAGLLITSSGVAMMDGTQGQQISVKNVSSQRVIQATVVNAGLVSVFF
ncbi:MAG: flagella basal body P-ring formation protein FlgA [Methylomonas sp.]|jgi:flagella basal body P-ring formation protein FlgA|nr:MAG: flagella basal body P-ring formation protein FlgA [Methylomonas sp.]